MVIFNSDLDNTLIFSYKHEMTEEKLCVEMLGEKELSFMTRYSYESLQEIRKMLCFVPTTTRSEEQYKRICFGGSEPEYALVCNGGVLLKDGVRDRSWYEESLDLVSESSDAMKSAKELLELDHNRCFEIRYLDNLFLFTKSSQPEETVAALKEKLNLEKTDVFSNNSKIYVIPKKLDKGTAALRLKKRLGGQLLLAAGDSLMDLPLLAASDRAVMPAGLGADGEKANHVTVFEGEGVFSDYVLEFVARELKESGNHIMDVSI